MIERIQVTLDALPEGSVLQLFKVSDGEAENIVQVGYVETGKVDAEGTRSRGVAFSACTCPVGFMNIPLSICGKLPKVCNHVSAVIEMLAKEMTHELV